jgi:hypothetical protein
MDSETLFHRRDQRRGFDGDRLDHNNMTEEGAKAPTRLPPDCDTPALRHQGRLRPKDNEHRRKFLVNVHEATLTPTLQWIDRQQSVR